MWVGPDHSKNVIKFWETSGSYSGYKKIRNFWKCPLVIGCTLRVLLLFLNVCHPDVYSVNTRTVANVFTVF